MNKIGIMSMQRINNYGSFLQAYALKAMLEELGGDVQFVDYHVGHPLLGNKLNKKRAARNLEKIWGVWKCRSSLKQKFQFILFKKNFSKRYQGLLSLSAVNNYNPVLDILIIGSDEVFNCTQSNVNVGYSLELFGKDNRANKLVSYAASFGNTTLEKLQEHKKDAEIGELLVGFDELSVRDRNSFDIVKKLTGKEAEIHFDPVLMYDFKKKGLCAVVKRNKEKYILLYVYSGRISADEDRWIKAYAKKKKRKIWAIGGICECADRFIACTPFEVFSYFDMADEVITDTFHGCVFSILTGRPFAVLVRKTLGDSYGNEEKIEDLLLRLGLEGRIASAVQNIEKINRTVINYDTVNRIVEKERKKAREYLGRVVNGCIQS